MSEVQRIQVAGRTLRCPVCDGRTFSTRRFHVAGSWLQIFDMEGFGQEGLMAICLQCSHIQHFADYARVEVESAENP